MKVFQTLQILQLNKEVKETDLNYIIHCVSIYLNTDINIINNFKPKELQLHYENLLNELTDETLLTEFEYNNINFGLVNFDYLTLNEWISLDHLLPQTEDNISRILSILYRPIIQKQTDLTPNILEKFNGEYCDYRHELYFDMDSRLINVIKKFIEWKSFIMDNFSNLFKREPQEEINLDELSPMDKRDVLQDIEKEERQLRWGWEWSINQVANGEYLKSFEVLDKPVVWIFNTLSFIQDRNA